MLYNSEIKDKLSKMFDLKNYVLSDFSATLVKMLNDNEQIREEIMLQKSNTQEPKIRLKCIKEEVSDYEI